jgi:hypothetical protein
MSARTLGYVVRTLSFFVWLVDSDDGSGEDVPVDHVAELGR